MASNSLPSGDLNAAESSQKEPTPATSKARLQHFTWAWYTLTMSTGGLALLLANQPHTFHGLMTIGKVLYMFDLILFVVVTTSIAYRFLTYPGTFTASFTHPTESLFFPTSFLSIATIISCMAKYGSPDTGPWMDTVIRILFWIYFATTFLSACFQYTWLFSAKASTIQSMTPAWILPVFPIMLTGTISASSIPSQPPWSAVGMIVGGVTGQGLGMLLSFLMFSQYLRRLMSYGLPSPKLRPGMFIAVGPPSFTGLALIGMAKGIPNDTPYFAMHDTAKEVLLIIATFISIFLWALALWFFVISLISCLMAYKTMTFHLTWWAFVFPNVGLTVNTIMIGNQLGSEGIRWVGSAMTILVVIVYITVLFAHARAVLNDGILYDGKDEDA